VSLCCECGAVSLCCECGAVSLFVDCVVWLLCCRVFLLDKRATVTATATRRQRVCFGFVQ